MQLGFNVNVVYALMKMHQENGSLEQESRSARQRSQRRGWVVFWVTPVLLIVTSRLRTQTLLQPHNHVILLQSDDSSLC